MLLLTLLTLAGSPVARAELRGDTGCAAGAAACNVCAPDVERQFARLARHPSLKGGFWYGKGHVLPPYGTRIESLGSDRHVQGFTRVPGVDGENWFAASRSLEGDAEGGAGFWLVKMGDLDGHGGEPLGPQHTSFFTPHARSARFFYPMAGTDHASGLQALGRTLAVAAECARSPSCRDRPAWVDFYDLSEPAQAKPLSRLLLDGSRGEPGQLPFNPRAAFASVTRLSDRRVLVFIGGSATQTGWFYVSDGASLGEGTSWHFLHHFTRQEVRPSGDAWDVEYQNMSFVNECGTGRIYLVGLGSRGLSRRFDLYRLDGETTPVLERVGSRSLGAAAPLSCQPRGGAAAYVSPEGRLVIYCATMLGKLPPGQVRFSEFPAQIHD